MSLTPKFKTKEQARQWFAKRLKDIEARYLNLLKRYDARQRKAMQLHWLEKIADLKDD